MEIHKTKYGEELYKIFLVSEITAFLDKRGIDVEKFNLKRYGFADGLRKFVVPFFSKDELFSHLEPEIKNQIEFQFITYIFPVDTIKEL